MGNDLPFDRFEKQQGKRYYFRVRLKDDADGVDSYLQYVDPATKIARPVTKLQGNIVAVNFKDREAEYNGKKTTKRNVTIVLQDEDKPENFYHIQGDFTSSMRSILNSLASQSTLGFANFSFYVSNGYAAVTVWARGDKMSWALDMPAQNALKTDLVHPKTQEKISTDYTDLDKKLEEMVKVIPCTPIATFEATEVEDEDDSSDEEVFTGDEPANPVAPSEEPEMSVEEMTKPAKKSRAKKNFDPDGLPATDDGLPFRGEL